MHYVATAIPKIPYKYNYLEHDYSGDLEARAIEILEVNISLKRHERRGPVKTIVMEHFNSILFYKSGPANKQYTIQPTNWSKQ